MRCDFFFFFSSRRRHTISLRDWSSDVCSSDLRRRAQAYSAPWRYSIDEGLCDGAGEAGSEERRVGKECRSRWWTYPSKKKRNAASEGRLAGSIRRTSSRSIVIVPCLLRWWCDLGWCRSFSEEWSFLFFFFKQKTAYEIST